MKQRNRDSKSSFFRSKWFYLPVGLILSGCVAAGIGYGVLSAKYGKMADQFDLAKLTEMESASILFDRSGEVFGHIYIQNRDTIPLSDVAPIAIKAIIAAEDARFYDHGGIDFPGIARAVLRNYKAGRIAQGASTITQQVARNTFDLMERSYERKLVEMFLARRIEKQYNKPQILESYLNRIYFGSGNYGIEAAAKSYFGKAAKGLTLGESATLAGLIKSPTRYSPWNNPEGAVEQRNFVLRRMQEEKLITASEMQAAVETPLQVRSRTGLRADNYAIDAIRQQVIDIVGFERATSDGFRVFTTFDRDIQVEAEKALQEQLLKLDASPDNRHETYADYDARFRVFEKRERDGETSVDETFPLPNYIQGALVMLENKTGEIISLVGGRNFNHSEYNRITLSRRPTGTAFTPIVFAAAFEKGLFPGELVDDGVIDNRQVMIGGETGILGEWGVESISNRYEGPIIARQALVKSKNAATVRFGNEVTLPTVLEMAQRMGIQSPLREYPSTFLGSSEVSLMEFALAYTNFPNGGERAKKPYMIRKIETKEGSVIYQARQEKTRSMKATTAYQVHHILRESLIRGTAAKAYTDYGLVDFEAGGKTGTAYGFTDTTFVGYSSEVTCAVWAGLDRPQQIFRGAFSNETVLPIWTKVMNAAVKAFPPQPIPAPEGIQRFEICTRTGEIATEDCNERVAGPDGQIVNRRTTYYEYSTAEQAPQTLCTLHSSAVRSYVKNIPGQEEWPRAVAVTDLTAIIPVTVQSSTIEGGFDPYQSVKPSPGIAALQNTANTTVKRAVPVSEEEVVEVRRAESARPFDVITDDYTIPLEAPPPIEF